LTGNWQPDGRAIDPLSAGSVFDEAGRSSMLSVFNGQDANGVWTLFIADASPGGEGTLLDWGISVVPERSSAALMMLSMAGGVL
jgi:subtilisin-like proprotein convertase family protein